MIIEIECDWDKVREIIKEAQKAFPVEWILEQLDYKEVQEFVYNQEGLGGV